MIHRIAHRNIAAPYLIYGFSELPLWIVITIAAAFLQNVRSSVQKYLKSRMGTTGATFVRFGFGMPFVLLLVAALHYQVGYAIPPISPKFLGWMIVGALSQIGATFLLVHLFSFRNFAVGTAYSRTEPAQAAVFGLLLLGESISAPAVIAIAICVVGVMLISVARTAVSLASLMTSLGQRTAIIGLVSGAGFGLSAVAYRGASLALGGPNVLMQAAVTLGFAITVQSLVMFVWILFKEPEQLRMIAQAWRPSLLVGIVGASASLGWFTAMTLQNAAVVKALAQVEMLFAFATTVLFFKEKINRLETMGCALIVIGIVFLMVWR
jgi:drug/metabolite transporter (DMT)-like permease